MRAIQKSVIVIFTSTSCKTVGWVLSISVIWCHTKVSGLWRYTLRTGLKEYITIGIQRLGLKSANKGTLFDPESSKRGNIALVLFGPKHRPNHLKCFNHDHTNQPIPSEFTDSILHARQRHLNEYVKETNGIQVSVIPFFLGEGKL